MARFVLIILALAYLASCAYIGRQPEDDPGYEGTDTSGVELKGPSADNDTGSMFSLEEIFDTTGYHLIPIDTIMTDLSPLLPNAIIDIHYATEDNFAKEQLYECPKCYLIPEAALALEQVILDLKIHNFGIKLYDCYRPHSVQKRLWEKFKDPRYVADPAEGSMHNRGVAVDLTLVDHEGNDVDMGSPYDHFGRRSNPDYQFLPEDVKKRRKLLQLTMMKNGFEPINSEWWHFSFTTPAMKPLLDIRWKCE